MRNFIILFLLLITGFWSGALAIDQELDYVILEGFEENIGNFFFVDLDYDLESDFEVVTEKYHQKMRCLFSTAAQDYTSQENEVFQDWITRLNSQQTLLTLPAGGDCETSFSDMRSTQLRRGYASQCDDSVSPSAGEDASLCQVAETAWNEFGAFQEYLFFKAKFLIEVCAESFATDFNDGEDCRLDLAKKIEQEPLTARKKLEMSLVDYETKMENWTLHGWFVVMGQSLKNTYYRLNLVREAVNTWPNKFKDATSQAGGSIPAE